VNIKELMEKYQILLTANKTLWEENEILKTRLGITDPPKPVLPPDHENHLSADFVALD
jgi:hypothetical protein